MKHIFKFLFFGLFFSISNSSAENYLAETEQFQSIAQGFSNQFFDKDFEKLDKEQLKFLAKEIIKYYQENINDDLLFYSKNEIDGEQFAEWPTDFEKLEELDLQTVRSKNSKKILALLCCIRNQISNINCNINFDPIINLINECCNSLHIEIENLFSTLTACCTSLHDLISSLSITTDLSSVFTVLADIKLTITECCAANQTNFNNTFTVLVDLKNTITECCESLHNLIASLTSNFTFTVTVDVMFQCDLTQVTSLLIDLKATVTECCDQIQIDFQDTWTILADLKLTLTECCEQNQINFNNTWTILANLNLSCTSIVDVDLSGVFTALADIKLTLTECCEQNQINFNNTFTVLVDIKNTITECCEQIQIDFDNVFTVLANLNFSCTSIVDVDLSGVFTALADIKLTLTECCEQNQINFNNTFTVLVDIKNTITECCEQIQIDFDNVFTVLANLNLSCTSIVDIDLSGVFTALADIKLTLTECCEQNQINFNATFTVLADLKNSLTVLITNDFNSTMTVLADIKNTLTACCNQNQINFNATFTVLADLKNSLTVLITNDFNSTMTVLADIKNTLTACCNQNQVNFNATFTVLADLKNSLTVLITNDFNSTMTVLADIKNTLTACCNQNQVNFNATFTVLADIKNTLTVLITNDFNSTMTVLADIKNTLTACCAQNQTNFNNTWTILATLATATVQNTILQTSTTTLSNLNANFCNPTFIHQSDFAPAGTTPYNINTGSLYKLAENITYNPVAPSNAITINSSGATLDLQCFSLSQTNAVTPVNGVLVSPNLSNVTIENGMIQGFTRAAISVQPGNSEDLVDNVNILSCATRGIEFQGASGSTITDSKIKDCILKSCCQGALGDFVITFSQCVRCNIYNAKLNANGISTSTNSISPIRLTNCNNCKVNKTKVKGTAGSSVTAFDLQSTSTTVLNKCTCRVNVSSSGNFTGFGLSNNCSANEFTRCKAIANTGATTCYGFSITGTQSLNNYISQSLVARNVASGGNMSGVQIDSANNGTIAYCVCEDNRSATSNGRGLYFLSPGLNWETKYSQFLRNTGSITSGTTSNSFGVLDPALQAAIPSTNLFLNNIAFLNGTNNNNQYATATNVSFPAATVNNGTTISLPAMTWGNLRVVS